MIKIITNSIKNLSSEYKYLQKSLEGTNYCVSLECKKFKFNDGFDFNMEHLKTLFSNEDIRGEIALSNFDDVKKDVENAMSHFSYENGMVTITSDKYITKARESSFWNILNYIFSLPPKIVYKHDPDDDSYFNFYVMWGFCYILLNEGEGLVISGQAWD